MKNLVRMLSLFLLLLCFACKKNNMPDLIDDASYLDSLRILDSINMVKIKTDSINRLIMPALIGQLGNYDVACRLRTIDIVLDSTGTYPIEVPIYSLFSDTLLLMLQNTTGFPYEAHMVNSTVNENTIFVLSELFHHNNNYSNNFFFNSCRQ